MSLVDRVKTALVEALGGNKAGGVTPVPQHSRVTNNTSDELEIWVDDGLAVVLGTGETTTLSAGATIAIERPPKPAESRMSVN